MNLRFPFFLFLSAGLIACTSDVAIPESVSVAMEELPELDFNNHIKPILSDRCFKCHGPDKAKVEAGLQLTGIDEATAVLESGATAIRPGNLSESELVRRVLSSDPKEMMPPPESHLSLSDREKAILIKWIKSGAHYDEHWSFKKIVKPGVPKAGVTLMARLGLMSDEQTRWVRNPIDNFVLAGLRENKLLPSTEANKATLLRRVYMDITGLPPSVDEVQEYLQDTSTNAYEKAVDRLLASPHFGEHQAVGWLDLARYADSHGYQDDGMRNAYPYRDWVIDAFNKNQPFDKFVTWQLAGDLIDDPSREMLVATSFNRQHPQTQEGGVVQEEYHAEYVADRTNTFGKAMLGLTMECARCHDHKYDPISAKDYYSLSAFFNQNNDWGEVPYDGEAAPTIMLPSKDVEEKIRYIREQISVSEAEVTSAKRRAERFDQYKRSIAANVVDKDVLNRDLIVHIDFEKIVKDVYVNSAGTDIRGYISGDPDRKPAIVEGKFGNAVELLGDCGIQLLSDIDRNAKRIEDRFYQGLMLERNKPFSLSFWFRVKHAGVAGPLVTRNNGEFEGFRGYDIVLNADGTLSVRMMYVYPSNGIELRTSEKIPAGKWTHVALSYDGSGVAAGLSLFINGHKETVQQRADNLTKSILHGAHKRNWSFMPFEIGKDFRSSIKDLQFDELRVYKRRLSQLEIETLARNETIVSLNAPDHKLLEFYLWNVDDAFRKSQERLSDLRFEEVRLVTDVPEVMVMQELPPDQKRRTYILERGSYDSPGEEVFAETPERLGILNAGYPRSRLGLAQWLLDQDNPLFARVMVNRIWQQFFGRGLVKTQEDFGNQGEMPTHPELLDWLAAQFRDDDWDLKHFIKRIVMSATYRQSSVASAEALEADPDNRWLARGPSHQYTAEQVRDNALAASGLLVRKIGGPSVYPYQPSGIWEALATRNAVTYEQHHGDSLYRRSLYTIWKRSSPPPMMLNFDVPDRQQCTVRRQRTATPLQALVTMNDPQFVEAARVLAERTIRLVRDEDERIRLLFLAVISREPRAVETSAMKELIVKQVNYYEGNRAQADALISAGEYPVDERLDRVELAAFTVAANAIMNYDEAVFKR